MGLFSFLFSKHKLLRTTYEAETFRAVFREDEELFLRVEKGEELKRYRELEEYVNSAQFKERRKEIEQLSYKDSENILWIPYATGQMYLNTIRDLLSSERHIRHFGYLHQRM